MILAFTIKGYGIGSRQADNTTHQVKKLSTENLKQFKEKFDLPIDESDLKTLKYLKFDKNSLEAKYLAEKRENLGGYLPFRPSIKTNLIPENSKSFDEFDLESKREMSTTMVFVRLLTLF